MSDNSPDFKKAYTKANEILCSSNIIMNFPFSPKSLIKEKSGIKCKSYSTALKYGVDIHDFGSDSATIFKKGGKTIIFYNEDKLESHLKFSLLHEFGHEYLGHNFNDKRPDVYSNFEIETNFFAAQLLMPEQILRELQKRQVYINHPFLQQYFGVSYEAADKRINTLARTNMEWRSRAEREFDDIILMKYDAFIDRIRPQKSYFDYEAEEERQRQRYNWY